jgi:hypothetical protein
MRTIMLAVLVTACGPSAATPDAAPDASSVPRSPEGTFAVSGQLDLVAIPPPAQAILDELTDATDGPDDPARYLVDRLIAGLPAGTVQTIALGAADLVVPYVSAEIDVIAPRFATGIQALAAGLGDVARHVGTVETFAIATDGTTARTITGLQLGTAMIDFAEEGMADVVADTRTDLASTGELEIEAHRVTLPYGRMLRLGLDRGVIPNVDLDATELSGALRDLVDCAQLGAVIAAHVPGSADLYEAACDAGLSALASDVYDRFTAIDASPFELDVTGTATAIDLDGDGTMDLVSAGTWIGGTLYASVSGQLGTATFEGHK